MYYTFGSYGDLTNFEGGKIDAAKKRGCLILVTMNGCPYCEMMKPEWRSFVSEHHSNPDFNIIEVERNMIHPIATKDKDLLPLSTLSGFPSISFRRPGVKEQVEFKDVRTKPKLLKFVKDESRKSVSKNQRKEGESQKQAVEGIYSIGSKKGKLKKGYHYVDGKPEKVKNPKTPKKSEQL